MATEQWPRREVGRFRRWCVWMVRLRGGVLASSWGFFGGREGGGGGPFGFCGSLGFEFAFIIWGGQEGIKDLAGLVCQASGAEKRSEWGAHGQ